MKRSFERKILDATLEHARRGHLVFPLARGLKTPPRGFAWSDRASKDREQIATWFGPGGQYEGHNFGVVTGPRSGLWVLDTDAGPGKVGPASRAALEAAHGLLPPTYTVMTPGTGTHEYFEYPDTTDQWRNSESEVGEDLDVRGDGGYVVGAPSRLDPSDKLSAGGRYRVRNDRDRAPVPAWLLALAGPQSAAVKRHDLTTAQWAESTLPGPQSERVRGIVATVASTGTGWKAIRAAISRIVRAGTEGEPGAADGLAEVRRTYLDGWARYARVFDATVAGSVAYFGPHAPLVELTVAPPAAADEIDGVALLDDVRAFLGRFVAYPTEEAQDAHVLWIGHAWLMASWESTPRIAFLSPEPGSGKTRALEVTEPLVPRPVHAVNATPAALFRKVAQVPAQTPTILFDEIDTIFGPRAKDNEDVRGMLNAGHRRGATAMRAVVKPTGIEVEELPAYCAVALAGLDDLPDTISTRSIIVRMRRRAPGEQVEPFRPRVVKPEADLLRDRLALWAAQVEQQVGASWPTMPEGVEDRNADVWEAPIAVADLAGGHWPATARRSAVAHVAASAEKAPTLGILLLQDTRAIFDGTTADRIPTDQLLHDLTGLEESPWSDLRGRPLDARGLAQRLRGYGISPSNIRVTRADGGAVVKGYLRGDFLDAWTRYLPTPSSESSATAATAATDYLPEEGTPQVENTATAATAATCRVCGAPLLAPGSRASGICGKTDRAHQAQRIALPGAA